MIGEDRKKSLEEENLIKGGNVLNLKGITCANGSKQKSCLKEDETVYSPTYLTDSLMSTLLIYDMEQRDVAVFGVTGAYLHTGMLEVNCFVRHYI